MSGWAALEGELDAWGAAGRAATFWWRDDDAVAPSPALERLADIAESAGAPLGLAVIPAGATPELADWCGARPFVSVLQHGYAHANHAWANEKKSEYPCHRPRAAALAEIAHGRARLTALMGAAVAPIFVPPWNRMAPGLARDLPGIGLTVVSAFPARPPGARGRLNAHVDPVAWRAGRGFAGAAPVLDALIGHLRARRRGAPDVDPAEPTGLLTHHLVTDAPGWAFLARLAGRLADHPAARWTGPADWMETAAP